MFHDTCLHTAEMEWLQYTTHSQIHNNTAATKIIRAKQNIREMHFDRQL